MHGLGSHSKSCSKQEQEWLKDKEFADIVQRVKKRWVLNQLFNVLNEESIFLTELWKQHHKICDNLQYFEDAQLSAGDAGEHLYFNDGTMLFSDHNIVTATTILAADIGMFPLL